MFRVADVSMHIGKRELHRFNLEMQALGRVDGSITQRQVAQHPQRHQCADALSVRRDLVNLVSAVVERYGVQPFRLVRRKVVHRKQATTGGGVGNDLFPERSAVERFAVRPRNGFERVRLIRKGEDLAGRGARPSIGERTLKVGKIAKSLDRFVPLSRADRRDQEPAAGILNGGLEQPCEGKLAELLREGDPTRNRAGDGHRMPSAHRHLIELPEEIARPPGRRVPGGVQAMQRASVPDDGEQIAADAVVVRFHHGQRRRSGDGGIDCVSTGSENVEPRLRRQRL